MFFFRHFRLSVSRDNTSSHRFGSWIWKQAKNISLSYVSLFQMKLPTFPLKYKHTVQKIQKNCFDVFFSQTQNGLNFTNMKNSKMSKSTSWTKIGLLT